GARRFDPESDATGTKFGSHRKYRSPRVRRRQRKSGSEADSTERQLGRILGIFERTIATNVQRSRTTKPGQLARWWRRPPPVSAKRSTNMTRTIVLLALLALSATIAAQTATQRT